MPSEGAGGGAQSTSKPTVTPNLRLNGHALFVHAAPHSELPDLPFLVDTGANVSMLPYNWYMAIPEAERPALAESPLQILAPPQPLTADVSTQAMKARARILDMTLEFIVFTYGVKKARKSKRAFW